MLTHEENTDTIKLSTNNQDGGPGSGRYPKGSGEKNAKNSGEAKKVSLKGTITSKGVEIKHVRNHVNQRKSERGISEKDAVKIVKKPESVYPDKKHEGRYIYQIGNKMVVVDHNTGVVHTAMKGKEKR